MKAQDESGFLLDFEGGSFVLRNDPPLRVYLAGPMTNNDEGLNRTCANVRHVLREELQAYVGQKFAVYDPGDVTQPGSDHSDQDVFGIDFTRTIDADLVVFHVISPSLGVGIECLLAATCGIPRIVINPKSNPLSRMFSGVFNPTLALLEYSEPDELRSMLREALPTIVERLRQSANSRRPAYQELELAELGRVILARRIELQKPLATLAEDCDILEFWLLEIERDDRVAATLSLVNLHRIARALDLVPTFEGLTPRLEANQRDLDDDGQKSLDALVAYLRGEAVSIPEAVTFAAWNSYVESRSAARHRKEKRVLSVEDWRRFIRDSTTGQGTFEGMD